MFAQHAERLCEVVLLDKKMVAREGRKRAAANARPCKESRDARQVTYDGPLKLYVQRDQPEAALYARG